MLRMKTRQLGRTGLEVSVVGFGGIPIQKLSIEEAGEVLSRALDLGITFFDTARGYTDSEYKIGQALADRRDEFVLATKSLVRDANGMTEELALSLANLRTNRIALYQLHAIGSEKQLEQVLGPDGAVEVLAEAQAQGTVGHIGLTTHSREMALAAIETGRFATVQCPFNPIETEWGEDVLPAAEKAGMGTIGMKPIAGGALSQCPVAAIRYELTHGLTVVIPGMDSVAQVEQNAAAGSPLRPPDAEEEATLAEEKERWTGEFCRRCGYCMPCPEGLNIPMLLLLQGYHERYEMTDWALERLEGLEKHYEDCTACSTCTTRCPYELPIPEMMSRGVK